LPWPPADRTKPRAIGHAIVHDFGNPAAISCDHGFTGRHGLNDYLPEGLGSGRGVHNQIQLCQGALNITRESSKPHNAFNTQSELAPEFAARRDY
jgi:hypothetical protein